jgi:ATP-dependent Clp protease adaptor protein ClpS
MVEETTSGWQRQVGAGITSQSSSEHERTALRLAQSIQPDRGPRVKRPRPETVDRPRMRYSVFVARRDEQTDGAVKERAESRTQDPTQYNVVLLNDDYTPMQFVVDVVETVFQKSPAEAYRIMMQVHLNGRGIAGVYSWEVAETKADTVNSLANKAGHPLKTTIEEA